MDISKNEISFIFLGEYLSLFINIIVGSDKVKYKGVYQQNTKDCGVACLLSIIKYYKGNNTFHNIRHLTKCDNNGVTALNLIEASKKIGFSSRGLKCSYEDLNNIVKPFIAHTVLENGYNHYVVVHKIDKNYVMIFDPYKGIQKYEKNEFLKIWDNIVIELFPIKKLDYIKETYTYFFKQIINDNKFLYLIIILFSFLSIIFTLISNYYFKLLIEFNNLFQIFIFFTFIIFIREIIDFIRNRFLIKLDSKVDNKLNLETHNKLLSLPYYYFNSRTSGDIITKFNDLEHIKSLLVKFPIFLFVDSILLILTAIILFKINNILFFTFIIVCLLYLLFLIISNKKTKKMIEVNQECNSIKNTILLENINSINSIKNMNIKKLRYDIFSKVYNTYLNSNIIYEKYYVNINLIKNIVLFIGINLILFFGMILVNNNNMSLSDLILFNSLIIYFIEPLRELCELSPIYKNGINAIKRVGEIYSIDISNKKIVPSNLDIKFNNLTFTYNGYDNILKNINYTINYKDRVIVIGSSGCGKSTMFKLLSNIYEVDRKMIIIGEDDINDVDTSNFITYVSQDEKLFNDTIYNNIVLCNNSENLENVLDITGVNNILKMRNLSLNSIIEEEGSNLSKGEKQKIILSRVLLKNSKIIILDESLSGVESKEEYSIINKILNYYKESTIIYISHSKECLSLFDKVLNLE